MCDGHQLDAPAPESVGRLVSERGWVGPAPESREGSPALPQPPRQRAGSHFVCPGSGRTGIETCVGCRGLGESCRGPWGCLVTPRVAGNKPSSGRRGSQARGLPSAHCCETFAPPPPANPAPMAPSSDGNGLQSRQPTGQQLHRAPSVPPASCWVTNAQRPAGQEPLVQQQLLCQVWPWEPKLVLHSFWASVSSSVKWGGKESYLPEGALWGLSYVRCWNRSWYLVDLGFVLEAVGLPFLHLLSAL